MKIKPEIHSFVKHSVSGLRAQVYKHYSDNDDYVGVIVLPQPGASRNEVYKKWRIDQINAA